MNANSLKRPDLANLFLQQAHLATLGSEDACLVMPDRDGALPVITFGVA